MYYQLKRRSPTVSEKDNNRLTRDITKAFGIVAKKLLQEAPNAFQVEICEIESNKGMQNRTYSLLKEAGVTSSWNKILFLKEQFMEHSREYGLDPCISHTRRIKGRRRRQGVTTVNTYESTTFPKEPTKIIDYLTSRSVLSEHELSTALTEYTFETEGYCKVYKLPSAEAIYVFWNLMDFDVKDILEDKTVSGLYSKVSYKYVYPKAYLKQRNKCVLKLLVKRYSELDFGKFLERRYKDNYDDQVYTEDDSSACVPSESITLRNFARFPITFSEAKKAFLSPKGYIKEYETTAEKVTYEYNRIKRLMDGIERDGGCAKVTADYTRECLADITNKVGLLLDGDETDKKAIQYILDHRDLFTYEYLYEDKEPL